MLFEGLDLQIDPGEGLHVAGPNGSGKSSLIRLAAGLLEPQLGRIERTPLALADDNLALDRELALQRALRFWGHEPGEALEALGLNALANVPVRFLSSGQLRRAVLARVIASDKPLWLLDEPLNALDRDGSTRLAHLIERHLASGGAVLAASHQELKGNWRRIELGS